MDADPLMIAPSLFRWQQVTFFAGLGAVVALVLLSAIRMIGVAA
jgi:hypothetical protein